MSLSDKLKRAFGFSTTADDDDLDTSLPVYAAGERRHDYEQSEQAVAPTYAPRHQTPHPSVASAGEAAGEEWDPSLAGDLFDDLIRLFNSTVPDFVASCLSTEAQKRYIYESLDLSLRRRLENLRRSATQSEHAAPAVREEVMDELVRLREQNRKVTELREQMEQMRLSSDRQKRALTDRVFDLQSKLDDAEIALEKMRAESASMSVRPVGHDGDDKEVESLRAEVARLNELNEGLRGKIAMSDAMINDLTAKASAARKEVEELNADFKVVEEISAQLDSVQKVVERKDARIAELKAEVEQLGGKLEMVQNERESLRRTIENNLYNQAHTENKLRKEIRNLEKKLAAGSGDAEKPRRKRKITAIDESPDNTSWFDSTPPPGEGKPDVPDNPDFGYQAPQRKKHTDNDAQMLLW